MNPSNLVNAISSAQSVKLGLASNPETSSAWVKTVIDPAHAREYACRGIPDENQQPTLVLNGRNTFTISPEVFYGTSNSDFYWDSNRWNSTTTATGKQVREIVIVQGGINQHTYLIAKGDCTVSGSSYDWFAVRKFDALVATGGRNARLVAQSYTVSWVGKEIDKAGYFEAGYLINSYSGDGNVQCTYDIDNTGNLVTFTGAVQDGVYAVSTFDNYDSYRLWKYQAPMQPRFMINKNSMYTPNVTEYVNPRLVDGGVRPVFITYRAYHQGQDGPDDNWVLRLTVNQAVEVMTPYNAGGLDAAVYDKASVEDVIALYDAIDLIFPARFNDFKKVWNWIKSNAPKMAGFASSVMRHFPATRGLSSALDALVSAHAPSINLDVMPGDPNLFGPSKAQIRRKKRKAAKTLKAAANQVRSQQLNSFPYNTL